LAALPTSVPVLLELPELTDVALLLEELAEVIGALEVVPAEEPVAAYTRVKGAVAAAGMLSV
jgi:hypothetical protein